MTYRKILLTTDGSEQSRFAQPHALSVAIAAGEELIVVEVIDSADQMTARTVPAYASGTQRIHNILVREAEEAVAAERAAAAQRLAAIRTELETGGAQHVECRVLEGEPGPTIVEHADVEGCDLIVMATHGRSGLRRALLGSVADYVARHASCPVLIARSPA